MKKYFKNMWVFFVILAVLGLIYVFLLLAGKTRFEGYTRGNNACDGQRVFDKGDLLTADEEASLQAYIEKAEVQIGCDIIVVTLNESIKDYAIADQGYEINESRYVMVYGDNFYDENAFGFDIPHGDGCVLVDNWYRGDSIYNYAYNWISTSGRMIGEMNSNEIQETIDDINEVVNDNPYKAYIRFVDDVVDVMSASQLSHYKPGYGLLAIIGAIFTVVLFFIFFQADSGTKTVNNETYLEEGSLVFTHNRSILENTFVTKRHIERSSSGGGGGGGSHFSSGGFSHGGGGGHH